MFKSDVIERSDDIEKAQWWKNNIMAEKILIDFVNNQLVPLISNLNSAKEMFESLQSLYKFNNTSRVLALKHHLHIKMARGESFVSFMNITE